MCMSAISIPHRRHRSDMFIRSRMSSTDEMCPSCEVRFLYVCSLEAPTIDVAMRNQSVPTSREQQSITLAIKSCARFTLDESLTTRFIIFSRDQVCTTEMWICAMSIFPFKHGSTIRSQPLVHNQARQSEERCIKE